MFSIRKLSFKNGVWSGETLCLSRLKGLLKPTGKTGGFASLLASAILLWGAAKLPAQSYVWKTIAGSSLQSGRADGTNSNSRFAFFLGIAAGPTGTVFVADSANSLIRRIRHLGNDWVTDTIAGGGTNFFSTVGTNRDSTFQVPAGIVLNPGGSLFVAEWGDIRQISLQGTNWVVAPVAGLYYARGAADGTNSDARFDSPCGMAFDQATNLFVTDFGKHTIRKLKPDGTNWVVTTVAGMAGTNGFADGTNSDARFYAPYDVAVDSAGDLLVADTYNGTIRKITPIGTNWVTTTIAGQPRNYGYVDGLGADARFSAPAGMCIDSAGNLFVAETGNYTIRKLSPVGTNWLVTTVGGMAGVHGAKDGVGPNALFYPEKVAVDSMGNLYVADEWNFTVRYGQIAALLRTSLSPNQLVLSWPLAASNYVLETSASVSPASSWIPLTNGITISGEDFMLTNQTDSKSAFFRLHKN